MGIDRRTFLRLAVPQVLLPALPLTAGATEPSEAVFVLVGGLTPATPAPHLGAFVEPFLGADIPFAVMMEAAAAPDPEVAALLRQILLTAPDRVEPVLSMPGLAGLPPYFQRRTASDAIQRMRGVLGDGSGQTPPGPVTIATDAASPTNFDALRCLGIRNVLTLFAAQAASSTGCAERMACLLGARPVTVADTADPTPRIEDAFGAPGWQQIVLSMAGIERLPVAEVRLRAGRAADAIGRALASGRHFVALPRDHARWFGEDQRRFIAPRIAPGPATASADMSAFGQALRSLGIAVTDTRPGNPATGTDLLLVPGAAPAFDDRGLFIRGETSVRDAADLLAEPNLMRDAILAIGPNDYATGPAREATLDLLRDLRRDAGTRLVDMPAFVAATVAPDPVFDLLRATRRGVPDAPGADTPGSAELLADARLAWRYFERFSIPGTGLCIDTADVQDGYTWLQSELTMWDLGSLIAAVMAAHEFGLIADTDFIARSELLVRALPTTRIGDLRLPCAEIAADTGAALSGDFNACDTGRLLSVLRELDAHPLTKGVAAERIAGWDLGGVVVGGHVHSVVNGRLVDRFRSHCAHYTARAFRGQGIAAASPYEVADMESKTDRAMQLLQALVGLDPLGAEPLLLEAVETGLSEPSALLADVLFGAQLREYERSGTLVCMSEAPINREPWFTYQGLNVASSEERWTVNATSSDPRFATPDFRHAITLVNTKAAYLWLATRPSAYSTLLARHVRDRARLDGMGFSPGVFVASGQGMPGYADINTNGIVLEAIAFILRGRVPRAGLQALPGP